MAETSKDKAANTAVQGEGDHDRVVMLSLKADGTPDQHNPEIIGRKEFAVEAAKEQFAQQAVAAVDSSDKDEHEKAAKAAEKRAESVVSSLHKG